MWFRLLLLKIYLLYFAPQNKPQKIWLENGHLKEWHMGLTCTT